MDTNKSVFERLESLEQQSSDAIAQNKEIINMLNDLIKQPTSPQQVNGSSQLSDKEIICKYIRESKKEHFWFGSLSEFNKSKSILNMVCIVLIIVGVISTILTTKAFGMYSTFTLFENIWLVCVCIILSYSCNAKKRMHDTDLMYHSCNLFKQDADGTWRDINKEKKRFKWFRRLSYLAVIANIIVIWGSSSGGTAVAATIFELGFLGLSIAVFFTQVNLFCMYGNFIFFTGKNTTGAIVTIVFDVVGKKLIPMDEFQSKYKFLFE